MTFDDLVSREPRLADLRQRCLDLPDGVCAVTFWDDIKPGFQQLVGWNVADPVLSSAEAYNLAFRETHGRLPDCVKRCPNCGGAVAPSNTFTGVHPDAAAVGAVSSAGVYDRNAGVRTSWILSVDMLGYSKGIRDAARAGRSCAHLRDLLRIIGSAYRYLSSAERRWALKIYSDNALIGYPVHDDGESELGDLFDSMAEFQLSVVLQGQFVRGGLAVGEAFVDEDIAYGLPLLEAHHAESKLASNPRVILTNAARRTLARHADYFDDKYGRAYTYPVLVDTADGKWFIDYLSRVSGNRPHGGLDESSLRLHRDKITQAVEQFDADPSIAPKYRWGAAYHNHVCAAIGRDDLAVAYDGDLPAAPRRLSPEDVDVALREQRARLRDGAEYYDVKKTIEIACRTTGSADDESGKS